MAEPDDRWMALRTKIGELRDMHQALHEHFYAANKCPTNPFQDNVVYLSQLIATFHKEVAGDLDTILHHDEVNA